MPGTNYRVDRVTKQIGTRYVVPCGMSTIIYIDNKPPSIGHVVKNLSRTLSVGEVLIFSKWIGRNGASVVGDYAISQVISADEASQVL